MTAREKLIKDLRKAISSIGQGYMVNDDDVLEEIVDGLIEVVAEDASSDRADTGS